MMESKSNQRYNTGCGHKEVLITHCEYKIVLKMFYYR